MRAPGIAALALVLWTGGGAPAWSGPPEPGREAHLTRRDDPGVELVFPCCRGVEPPAGFYLVRAQDEWRTTPFSLLIGASGLQPVGESVLASLPLAEAGRVRLPGGLADAGFELHLLHAGSYLEEGFPRWEVAPRRPADEVGAGVLLPAGPAIGALWSRKRQGYVALSRPFEVRGHQTVEVPFARPSGKADLFLQVQRHTVASTAVDLEVELAVRSAAGARAPDLEVLTADRVYAVWYGLPPGPAELTGRSKRTFLEPQPLDLRPGVIEHRTASLQPRPALEVQLGLPAPLRQEKLSIEIRREPSGEVVAQHALPPGVDAHRFTALPPAVLEVVVQTSFGSFSRQVDLGSGQDGFLRLEPELVTLRGTVYHGDERRAAKLSFTTVAAESLEARSDEEGLYEIVLVNPVRGVSIELDGVAGAPYTDFFAPALAESGELDFHIPDIECTVRVLDAATGQGIPGASVLVRNLYRAEDDDDFEVGRRRNQPREEERVVSQAAPADESGTARLAALRRGEVEIRAMADGYLPLREPITAQALGDEDQSFEVRLDPIGARVALRLWLPGGTPAAGTDVLLADSLALGTVLFSGRTDGEGVVEVPRGKSGTLLARHPSAAFLVQDWSPRSDEGEVEWALPAAGAPLTIRVRDSSGTGASAQAELALWVRGRRLSGAALAWLTGAAPVADANGYWSGTNLPRGSVEILAWSPRTRDEALAGSLDAQATGIPYPWPEPAEVRAVD